VRKREVESQPVPQGDAGKADEERHLRLSPTVDSNLSQVLDGADIRTRRRGCIAFWVTQPEMQALLEERRGLALAHPQTNLSGASFTVRARRGSISSTPVERRYDALRTRDR